MLNRDLYKFSSVNGGSYKNIDNVIEETLPNGSKYMRFKPVDALSTPDYMERLCEEYRKEIGKEAITPSTNQIVFHLIETKIEYINVPFNEIAYNKPPNLKTTLIKK